MKTLSLWQPWASFIAIGAKPFETRDWSPPRWLIGQRIAIHAAKKAVNADDREWARRHGIDPLPLGAVVCTAILRGAYQCGRDAQGGGIKIVRTLPGSLSYASLNPDEFGDYADGRWAWLLTNIERVDPAIPARGAQGIWDWTPAQQNRPDNSPHSGREEV